MNRNYHGCSLSSLLQQISYFKNDVILTNDVIFDLNDVILTIFVKNDVILGENDIIRQNNVIFNIYIRAHRLANEFPKVFLLINRFKSDFKSVNS